ncbi:hypothetical protein IV203_022853 [Nitzschia inconspicua]|uniref:Uncharacterized protein n=1 Tax=Nitzschia inconspicua TaxID=303405 RepID=A0A9K3K4I8_9STRA|nr:hypothetical protein IV203_022853 [Nitzschia inconspicua]
MFVVKLFSADNHAAGNLFEYKTNEWSVEKIMQLPTFKDVEVLILDAPTQASNKTGQAGVDAFEWAGKRERESGRRVIHVSSLGSFAHKQTIRDQFNLREVKMRLFTRDDYVKSLSDPDLKKQVCDTLGINDPESVTNQDVVDQKFFYSGINARWFYNKSIAEIIDECTEIVQRLDNNVTSTGPKDPRAVNSVLATAARDGRIIRVYTSCHLAQYIGSSKGSYHNKFLKLFPFVAHTLGTCTPGEIFESDFRLQLEQCHNLRVAQIAIMGPDKAEDVMVVLGKHCDGDKSKILCPAGKINILPDPPKDPVALHQTMLPAAK